MFLSGGDIDLAKYCEDLTPSHGVDKDATNKHYSHNMLEWVRSFDIETRQRILLARGLNMDGEQNVLKIILNNR